MRRLAMLMALAAAGCAHASDPGLDAARQALIQQNLPQLQECWLEVANQYPGASGSLLFSVDVRKNGSVDWVDVEVDEIGAPKLVACSVRRIKKWKFPEGKRQTIGFGVGFVAP